MSAHGSLSIDPAKQDTADAVVEARFDSLDRRLRADVEDILEAAETGPVALDSKEWLARRTLDLLNRRNLGR